MKRTIILLALIITCVVTAKACIRERLRNVCYVHINEKSDSLVYCCGKLTPINQLKDRLKEYIANTDGSMVEVDGVGLLKRSEAVIALQTTRSAKYKTYFAVQNEVSKAYNELREELALALWSCSYNQLKPHQQDIVQGVYPMRVSDTEPRYY